MSGHNSIGIRFEEKGWDPIPSVTVDKEGQFPVLLRPRIEGVLHRLLCDVTVVDNVKLVTLRSTYKIDNECMYPLEVILVDEHNTPLYSLQKIGLWPYSCLCSMLNFRRGEEKLFSSHRGCHSQSHQDTPRRCVYFSALSSSKSMCKAGFGFGWSTESYKWEDFAKRSGHTVTCRSQDAGNAPFRLSIWADKEGESSK